jgi:hypothetical protein
MWKLIYAHDVNGTQTAGDKAELFKLVHGGQPVRVMFDVDDTRVTSLSCDSVFIRHGEVFAQTSFVNSEWADPDRELMKFSTPSSVVVFNLSTSGKGHFRTQRAQNDAYDGAFRYAISWYVQD